jgi:hypothetical protein
MQLLDARIALFGKHLDLLTDVNLLQVKEHRLLVLRKLQFDDGVPQSITIDINEPL